MDSNDGRRTRVEGKRNSKYRWLWQVRSNRGVDLQEATYLTLISDQVADQHDHLCFVISHRNNACRSVKWLRLPSISGRKRAPMQLPLGLPSLPPAPWAGGVGPR